MKNAFIWFNLPVRLIYPVALVNILAEMTFTINVLQTDIKDIFDDLIPGANNSITFSLTFGGFPSTGGSKLETSERKGSYMASVGISVILGRSCFFGPFSRHHLATMGTAITLLSLPQHCIRADSLYFILHSKLRF
jgi:hypothetical protein